MREISMQSASAGEIRNAVLALRSLEDVVIFRAGSARRSREQWQEILQTTCSLGHDRRHYDFSGKLEIADWWEISYQPDKATSYAYSNTRQPLHTDNAWFADPAEINFFLMEKQALSGGEQMIYRLSRLIEDLSAEQPALFGDLCSAVVTIRKGDG
ncbi:MAG TPA: TauD/TfdA family dioxygenase, partial [Burkholderiales bacterium]|nr:TauD/TfdA family dioxygenase [Burkholderiales bacterium]